jgi:site-specific recombinase XerD
LDTGVRVGEALGLLHEDLTIAEKTVTVVRRDNANRALPDAATTPEGETR